jgi:hypothetical protein
MNYWELVAPTYIENWTQKLYALSIPQIDVPLTLDEAKDMTAILWGEKPKGNFVSLTARLNEAIPKMPSGAFIRLGSRSPKDSSYGHLHGFKATTGKDALSLLVGDSERVFDDLCEAINHDYIPHIWIRQWIDIPKWSEFRCFMQDHKITGISQYYYRDGAFNEIIQNADTIKWAIEQFFPEFSQSCHLDSVVFDVFLKKRPYGDMTAWGVKLIEINPFFQLTDPCLFNWHKPEDFNGEFRYNKGAENGR